MSDNKYELTDDELDAVASVVFSAPNNKTLQIAFAKIMGQFLEQAKARKEQKVEPTDVGDIVKCGGCAGLFDLGNTHENELYENHNCETYDAFCDNYGTVKDCACESCQENKENE
jgi:hypothetical protein